MWFLILQMSLLLLLAAALGAALAWWWIRSRQEDVTEKHEILLNQVARFSERPGVTREDLEAGLASVRTLISDRSPSEAEAVSARLERIERLIAEFRIPEPNLAPLGEAIAHVHQRLSGVEAHVASVAESVDGIRPTDTTPIQAGLQTLAGRFDALGESGLAPIAMRLSQLTDLAARQPTVDLRPVDARLARIEDLVGTLTYPRLEGGTIEAAVRRVEDAVSSLRSGAADLQPIRDQLAALTARMQGVEGHSVQIWSAVSGLHTADLDPIEGGVGRLEESVDVVVTELSLIRQQVTALQSAPGFAAPGPAAVSAAIAQIDERVGQLGARIEAARKLDIEEMSSRLAAISRQIDARPGVDARDVEARLAGVERLIAGLDRAPADLSPIYSELNGLQRLILDAPSPDLSQVSEALQSLESRLDLAVVEGRLTAIEHELASVHRMLRSRPEPARADVARSAARPVRAGSSAASGSVQLRPVRLPDPRDEDPLAEARRPDDEANLLIDAVFGPADDLERIQGVDGAMHAALNEIGVFYFWQIADWGAAEVSWVDARLPHARGRIRRDEWVGQARAFASLPGAAQRPGGAPRQN